VVDELILLAGGVRLFRCKGPDPRKSLRAEGVAPRTDTRGSKYDRPMWSSPFGIPGRRSPESSLGGSHGPRSWLRGPGMPQAFPIRDVSPHWNRVVIVRSNPYSRAPAPRLTQGPTLRVLREESTSPLSRGSTPFEREASEIDRSSPVCLPRRPNRRLALRERTPRRGGPAEARVFRQRTKTQQCGTRIAARVSIDRRAAGFKFHFHTARAIDAWVEAVSRPPRW